jgi:6-phosphogluconolactonase
MASSSGLGVTSLIVGGYTAEMGGTAAGLRRLIVASHPNGGAQFVETDTVELVSPSYLIAHPREPWLFVVSEGDPSSVSSLRVNSNGTLTTLSSVQTGGSASCHLAIRPARKHLVVANYGSGSVSSFAIAADGSLTERLDLLPFSGSGPDPDRQVGPHAHQVVVDGDELLVCDLGTDQIHRLRLDEQGRFSVAAAPVRTPVGSGPRHLVVVEDHCVVACELSAELLLAQRTGRTWEIVQRLPSTTNQLAERSFPSGIVAAGDRIYVANRGAGTVAVFDLDHSTGKLVPVAEFACGGSWPRDLTLSSGHLWVTNQTSNRVSVFPTDRLPPASVEAEFGSPTPTCIVLLPLNGPR